MTDATDSSGKAPNNIKSTAWIVLARTLSNGSAFVLMVMAARVLTPAQFGAFALVSAVAVLLTNIAEAGWEPFILSWMESESPPPTVLTCALATGAGALALGLLCAIAIHSYFADATSALLMVALSVTTLPAAFNSVQFAMIIRSGNVVRIAQITVIAEVGGLLAGLYGLHVGQGVFALATGKIVYQFGTVLGTMAFSRWLPRPEWDVAVARRAFLYSWSVVQTKSVRFVNTYGADFVIGGLLGAADVGIYRAGSRIVAAANELVSEPTRLVTTSVLSRELREHRSTSQLGRSAVTLSSILVVVATPIFLGLALASGPLIGVMLGPQWQTVAAIVTVIALARVLSIPGMITEALFCTIGRPQVVTRLTVVSVLTSLVCLAAFASFGIFWVGISVLVSAILFLPVTLIVNDRAGGLAWKPLITNARVMVVPGIAMALVIWQIEHWTSGALSPLAILSLQVTAGAATYGGLLMLFTPGKHSGRRPEFLRFLP